MRLLLPLLTAGSLVFYGCDDDSGTSPPRANFPPTLQAQRDTTCAVGHTLRLQAVAVDPDGDPLRYSVTFDMTWEEIRLGYFPASGMDERSGWFWFRPLAADRPGRRVSFVVDDGRGGSHSTSFLVSVP